jgi:hypothetical protein
MSAVVAVAFILALLLLFCWNARRTQFNAKLESGGQECPPHTTMKMEN